ncbi:unnamed protein product [Chilo suppressalis]|uniref:Uncharacterized protein n=1 Tax=Chilo suppressalis TaxID=168631 RepID=A0ABN8BB48_CHISP|nr:unnamed protein product [Chilo suppressalis]
MGLGNVINSIPVFGHIKAGVHVLTGDTREAAEAFHAANRSTAVVAGGAAGAIVGGPAGMIGGAIAAGTACDGVSSVANHRAEGVFEGLRDIGRDISDGKVPVKSVLKTGLYVGADALSGATGGSVAANIPKAVGKSLLKDAVTVVAKSTTQAMVASTAGGRATREIANTLHSSGSSGGSSSYTYNNTTTSGNSSSNSNSNSGNKSQSNKTNSNSSSSGGGGQPPQNNKNNPNKTEHEKDQTSADSHLQVFYRLFGNNITSLEDIQIAGVDIFSEISGDRARKNTLKKLIAALRDNNILERVIETVQNIFKNFDRSEVTFQNFMYLTEMVSTYITERLARRQEMQISKEPRPRLNFHLRRAENLRIVLQEILEPGSARNILNIFGSLRTHIEQAWRNITPTFANIIAAVTHYFKHKFVPASVRVLSISEYFALINSILPRVLRSSQYGEMVSGTRRRLLYDVYRSEYGRRVRIVLQVQGGVIVLSSCHILDVIVNFDDKDGNEQFDPDY